MQPKEYSSHIEAILDPDERLHTLRWISGKLAGIDCDTIAVCGASGMLAVSVVDERPDVDVILVRKKEDSTHSKLPVEGVRGREYVIIDDLVSSGDTITHIVDSIKEFSPHSQCVGVLLYHPSRRNSPTYNVYTGESLTSFLDWCQDA